ncbi:MAG: hypothetical protein H7Z12_06045 [Rhodospirillaceae bacterium]|nr:hypothetical protein [Rhodospirillales bacterium]
MLRPTLVAVLIAASVVPALAQQPINLLPPRETIQPPVPAAEKPLLDEPAPNFQPMRPAEPEAVPMVQVPAAAPAQAQAPAPASAPASAAAEPAPAPVAAPEPAVSAPAELPPVVLTAGFPAWALGVLILAGAFLAALFGILTALLLRRGEVKESRRAVAATLATELETRRLAYESLPLPPNAEAGVSFVSSVTSLAGIDTGFRAVQGNIHLLPPKVAANVSVHYAAVQRVSDFVKGQSLAAAVRMLQANRLGGHPCPDAGAMRDAHVELGAAFRGVDKLAQALRALG